jgi:hypothetical protein
MKRNRQSLQDSMLSKIKEISDTYDDLFKLVELMKTRYRQIGSLSSAQRLSQRRTVHMCSKLSLQQTSHSWRTSGSRSTSTTAQSKCTY